ncbi:SusC/RagA family TonB-linked outer membrane protein [Sphingobacterium sp. SYP-B4668]|uniref:SusC/RagA family TonB-linked outer membrane protein n=1 Tax=Sphingobacterium sp. SYP-B4668 TaxID=2996035 RepID=UPI0022DE5AAD|nr:SusC/RagA family TonB-linked outer membrane protein [Sphingobacterium sp. SYP-B4668]
MKRKLLLLFFGLMLISASLMAQQKTVTGNVSSSTDGTPLSNVTVLIKGKSISTQTNADGSFSIQASPGDVLIFRSIGAKEVQQTVGVGNSINISLVGTEEALGEVVVTALGIKKEKRSLGYAVQDIKGDELMKNKNPNLINSLNGKIAGLNITNSGGSPGASASIIIRGGTSLERDNQPLFVIDGMPMDNSTGQGDNSAFDGSTNISTTNGNRAMDINPEDIESISVLKGPTAAALYGIRAAAGAIVITTKRGKDGGVSIGVNSRFGANWVNKLPEQQSKYRQGSNYNNNYTEETYWSWGKPFVEGEQVYDNLGDFFKTGYTYDNSFNVTGGNQKGNFYLSGSNIDQSGIVPTTDYNRTTFRFNGEQKYGIFTIGANTSYSTSKTRKTLTGSGLWGSSGSGYMESIIAWPRNRDMKDWQLSDGSQNLMFPDILLENNTDNPYWIINRNPQDDKTNRFLGTVYATAKLAKGLDFTYRLGIDTYTSNYVSKISRGSAVKLDWQKGMMSENIRQYNFFNNNLLLNYNTTVAKDWGFNFLAGLATEDIELKVTGNRAQKFILPDFMSLNNAKVEDKFSYTNLTRIRRVGVFGDAKVDFRNIAFLGVTLRNDWSSTLPKKNQSFMYPSFSGSLVFSEMIGKNDFFNYGKLRASWAEVGKDAPAYQTNTYLKEVQLTVGGGFRNEWTAGNENLKPEKTQSFEVGTDLKFLNNRLGLEFTYYNNRSVDQILQPRVDNATGYILKYVNAGTLENKGVEVTLNYSPIKRSEFKWDIDLNFSHNKGTVKDLPGDISILYVTDVQVAGGKAASFENGNFMGISGTKWNTDEQGNTILDWNTGLPTPSALETNNVGNREPSFIGGLNNSFTYKDWNLSFLFDFRKGGQVLNGTEYLLTQFGLSKQTEGRGDMITLTGVAKNPATGQFEQVSREVVADQKFYQDYYVKQTSNFLEEVNWVRLRSVNLSYNLPSSVLAKSKVFKGATFNLSGTNLLLFTNYSGMDPEVSAAGAGVVGSGSVGIDYAGVPNTRGVTFGVNLKF